MADKNIKSVLLEERVFPPPPAFAARARIKPADLERLRKRAREDHVGFWSDLARRELTWHKPFTQGLDDREAPNYRWFADGQLNASHNCLDIHLAERGSKAEWFRLGMIAVRRSRVRAITRRPGENRKTWRRRFRTVSSWAENPRRSLPAVSRRRA